MGSILRAKCSCGFDSGELLVGGGFHDFMTVCEIPCYCDHCGILLLVNVKNETGIKKYNKCPKCMRKVKYYGEISDGLIENYDEVFDWNINDDKSYLLKEGPHYCPKCKKENLIFFNVACWD